MLARYIVLVTLTWASLYALIAAGSSSAPKMLVDAGAGGGDPQSFAFWLLAAIATLITFSLCRFVIFGIPSMIGSWYESNKQWLLTLVVGVVVCGWFYLM